MYIYIQTYIYIYIYIHTNLGKISSVLQSRFLFFLFASQAVGV